MTVSNSTLHVTFLLLRAFNTRRLYNKHLADFYFQRTEYNHMTVATTNCNILTGDMCTSPLQIRLNGIQNGTPSSGPTSTTLTKDTSSLECFILVTKSFSIMWQILYSYIFFKRFYFDDKTFLNHVADFL